MTNRQLKKKIREAFAHGTPDISQEIMMDTLFSDPHMQEEAVMTSYEQRKPIRFPVFSVAAAACAAIAVLAISINLIANRPQGGTASIITSEEAVTSVQTYLSDRFPITAAPTVDCNLDADGPAPHYDIIVSYPVIASSFSSMEFTFVVDALTGEVLSMEQVPVKIDPKDPITLEEAMQIVLKAAQLDESQITDSVLEMYLTTDQPHYDITFRAQDSLYRYKVDPFTGEILDKYILHAMDGISEEIAKDIALKKAQVTADQISNYCIDWDGEEWPIHYEISFVAQGVIYEFEIHALNGEILKMEKTPMVEEFISLDDALTLFTEYLNQSPAPIPAKFNWSFQDYQGRMCYDIIHEYSDGSGVRMKIDAITGALLLKETADGLQPIPTPTPTPPDGKTPTGLATSIALKEVGLSSQRLVSDFELEEDRDGNYPHYDISFVFQGVKYTFEIGMYDGGQILSVEKEPEN